MQTITVDCSARGNVLFTPTRDPAAQQSWGRWECWRNCTEGALENGTVGLVPTGDWIAWDSESGRVFGFPKQESAEQLCVLQNGDSPTRVMDPFAGDRASEWTLEQVRALLPTEAH